MVVAIRCFTAFLLVILQLSSCYSKNLLEENKQEIQKICDKHQQEGFDNFVKKVKEDVDKELSKKVDVMAFNVSDSSPAGKGWDYKIGKKYGEESNGIILATSTTGKGVAIFLTEFGCKNQSIFRQSITGDQRFSGPCQQLLEAMAKPYYIHGVCANFKRWPAFQLEKTSHFLLADYCFKKTDRVFTFTKATTRGFCEMGKAVRVFVRQRDNCNN